MEFVVSSRELLIAVILASVVYLLETLLFSRRRRRADPEDLSRLVETIGAIKKEVRSLRERLDSLESGVVERKPGQGGQLGSDPAAYDAAAQYAREGMEPHEIAARCGISRDEAALIAAMYRRGRLQ